MSDLNIYQQNGLPAQPTDLAKFIIVAQAEFLRELEPHFREAYSWAAAQLGVIGESETEKQKLDTPAYDQYIESITIKKILAQIYWLNQTTYDKLRSQAWQVLVEGADVDNYEFIMRGGRNISHRMDGIQAAAEALGITKDELVETAQAIRAERGGDV